MRTTSVGKSDVGRARSNNEDAVFRDDDLGLYIVCDGMGGHDSGELASATACRTAVAHVRGALETLERARADADVDAATALVTRVVQAASQRVHEVASAEGHEGMGTTMTLVLMLGGKGVQAHVGDSRFYLRRQGLLHLMSSDHTGAAELHKTGAITEAQAQRSPLAAILTRAVGTAPMVEVDTLAFDVLAGDRFLLCSDGLTRYFPTKADLLPALDGEASAVADLLIAKANEAGGRDNISVVVVDLRADEGDATDPAAPDVISRRIDMIAAAFGYRRTRLRHHQRLLDLAELRCLDPGEQVVGAGDALGALYLVDEGTLEVTHGGETSKLEVGASFGRRTLVEPGVAKASVTALGPAVVLEISRHDFWAMVWRHPIIGVQLLGRMATRPDVDLV